jgi:hypothetical protein
MGAAGGVTTIPTFARIRNALSGAKPRCVVYTCMFGYSEHFNDFAYERDDRIDYVCFTDDPALRSDHWEIRVVPPQLLDPPRASKRIKAMTHRFLPEYDWSLYVDNVIRLKWTPREIFDRFLAPAKSPFVCFRNPFRDCAYEEADWVLSAGIDDPERVRAQMRFYEHLGFPRHAGLGMCGVLLRRHGDPVLAPVMERWHQQVLRHSVRDQLSLNAVAWFDRFEIEYLSLNFHDWDMCERPVLKDGVRLPRDFDDARYKELNPDVDFNCRRHYLLYGAAEGRAYK